MRILPVVLCAIAGAMLTGCGMGTTTAVIPAASNGVSLGGVVHGGQSPVTGATIQLYALGTGGYGSAMVPVGAAVTTNSSGAWALGAYTCPSATSPMVLLATGGNAGSGTNTALAEAAMLGPCGLLTSATFISVSEVTTVATAYALAQFATITTGSTGIGAPASNVLGMMNAFGPYNNLVSNLTGSARTPAAVAGLVLPQAELNTLGNVLAGCVNSTGSTAPTAPCGMLFAAATPAVGTAPADTLQAAFDIALNPGNNVTAVYNVSTAVAPFQPSLTGAPNDFALGIEYTGGGITGSYGTNGMAIDAAGNAWIDVGNTTNVHQLTEISPAGVYISGATGYGSTALSAPQGIAIDRSGNVFVTDANLNKVLEFSGTNGALLGTFSAGSLNVPLGIAVDLDGSLWVANENNASITHLTAAGLEATGSPYAAQNAGFDIAVTATSIVSNDFVYTGGTLGYITDIARAGTTLTPTSYPVSGHAQGLALDRSGYAWFTTDSSSGSTVNRINPANGIFFVQVPLPSQFNALEVFVDGLNQTWVSTQTPAQLTAPGAILRYTSAGALTSPTTGFTANNTVINSGDVPTGIAADNSGNLWITGYVEDINFNPQPNAFVTELVGMAGPVVTPLAAAAANGTLATRP